MFDTLHDSFESSLLIFNALWSLCPRLAAHGHPNKLLCLRDPINTISFSCKMIFLSLAPKLRNKIYHCLVVSNEFSIDGIRHCHPEILATCSKIKEAGSCSYACNIVCFSVPHNTPWLPALENGGAYLICPQERLTLSCLSR